MRTREEIEKKLNDYNPRTPEGGLAHIICLQLEVLLDIRDLLEEQGKIEITGSPIPCMHNMQPFNYKGNWGASVPPPTEKCSKCGYMV